MNRDLKEGEESLGEQHRICKAPGGMAEEQHVQYHWSGGRWGERVSKEQTKSWRGQQPDGEGLTDSASSLDFSLSEMGSHRRILSRRET